MIISLANYALGIKSFSDNIKVKQDRLTIITLLYTYQISSILRLTKRGLMIASNTIFPKFYYAESCALHPTTLFFLFPLRISIYL